MIVPAGDRIIGRIEVLHSDRGYLFQGTGRLDFAGEAHLLFDLLTHDILDQFMRAHPDLLWVHAGAVGKSTLATILRVWRGLHHDSFVSWHNSPNVPLLQDRWND